MRTFTVTLTKPGYEAVATIRYKVETWPESVEWSGEQRAFRQADDTPIKLACSMGWLERMVRLQAAIANASWEITHDDGALEEKEDEAVR